MKVISWIVNNKLEAFILLAILVVGAYLRLSRISEYMTFLGDEGRDAIIVRRFLVNFDPILIGPGTSIGNMYLGPLYYYLMAPALLLSNFSPVGPAVMISILGIVTVFCVWFVTREWFGRFAAFVAGTLYSLSFTVIQFSRSSWNPNIMPFFSLICIYSVWRIWHKKEFNWLIVLGISYAFVLQSHYLGLLLAPVLGIFWLLSAVYVKKVKNKKDSVNSFGEFVKKSVLGLVVFLILMSPLIIFDVRHGWMNFNAMKVFFGQRQTTVSARPWTSLPKIPEISGQVLSSLVTGANSRISKVINVTLFIYLLWSLRDVVKGGVKNLANYPRIGAKLLLITWVTVSLVGLGLYKQHIYDHYYGFFFAAPFILIGSLFGSVSTGKKWFLYALSVPVLLTLVYFNIKASWLFSEPGNQLRRSAVLAGKMVSESGGEKFNMAVIAERNYEGAYQYFLEKDGADFVMIDPQKEKETVTDQLFVVCEMSKEKCDPTTNPKAGIANFGWSKVDRVWETEGVILYKLIHNI